MKSINSELYSMQRGNVKQWLKTLYEKVVEVKEVQIVIGAHKKPKDKDDIIIFHIDI